MRTAVLGLVCGVFLGGCGDPIAERIDAVLKSGVRYVHGEGETREGEGTAVESIAGKLRESPDCRAILDHAAKAVPSLVRLLDDPERRTLAAMFLAEIGGDEAANALLDAWRRTRDEAREQILYRAFGDGWVKLGYHYEGIDHAFYRELLVALAHAGAPVSAEIAKDTEASIAESERLLASGAQVLDREEREEDGRRIEVRRRAPPVETACEGLRLLAMLRAPEAPSELVKALRSPVGPLRRTAVRKVLYIAEAADELLPALGPLLDDPDLRIDAAEQVTLLLDDRAEPAQYLPGNEQTALVVRCKERLRELGHLR